MKQLQYLNNRQSNMLLPEDLFPEIPRKIGDWTTKDVQKWFKLNGIQTRPDFSFQSQNFDGNSFLEATPHYLMDTCGVTSKIIIKKILEWLEHDREQFEEYVQQQSASRVEEDYITITHKEIESEEEVNSCKDKENVAKNNLPEEKEIHSQSIIPVEVKKWKVPKKKPVLQSNQANNSRKSEQISIDCSKMSASPSMFTPNSVKWAQSNYQVCESHLKFTFDNQVRFLNDSGRIGRNNTSDIIILHDSVSRQHGDVLKKNGEYFIRDIGSKFGTFYQVGKDQGTVLQEGDVIAFEDYYIQIMSIKINKSIKSFDLRYKKILEKESIVNLYNKKMISIGREGKDINFNDLAVSASHARLILLPTGQVAIQKEEGICFKKIKKDQMFRIDEEKLKMRFGLQIVELEIVRSFKPILNINEFSYNRS